MTAVSTADISPQNFARLSQFITLELGIQMPAAKMQMLQSRLARRLRDLEIDSVDEYLDYLFHSPNSAVERVQFINVVTTNKTDFFREPQHFDYLVRVALPKLDAARGKLGEAAGQPWRLKLWCAGCSSGEEPYTEAMVLSEYMKQRSGFDFRILATDVSTRMLAHAQSAIYEEPLVIPIPVSLRKSYLLRNKAGTPPTVRIVPELRRKISFHPLNFMDADYRVRDQFDVIFFRNVMIYFDKPTQEKVINKLCQNLKTGGYLFIGHSESLAGLKVPMTAAGSSIYVKA